MVLSIDAEPLFLIVVASFHTIWQEVTDAQADADAEADAEADANSDNLHSTIHNE